MTAEQPASQHGPGTESTNVALVWTVAVASATVAAAFPVGEFLAGWWAGPKRRMSADFSGAEVVGLVAAALTISVWVFVFWSLIGSFLNVVVHRMPRGESVVLGGSRCPRCMTPILWHDNLPIVGWLRLGGRCRACGLPIAARYPLVESVCAGIGTAIFFREVISGGANLPGRQPDTAHGGLLRLLPDPSLDLVGLCLFHAAAVCVLLVWGLIAWDHRRVPPRTSLAVLATFTCLPAIIPWLHPLDLMDGLAADERRASGMLARVLAPVVGAVIGGLCGGAIQGVFTRLPQGDAAGRSGFPFVRPRTLPFGLALAGAVVGWQGLLLTCAALLGCCLLHLLLWSSLPWWPAVPVEIPLVPAMCAEILWWRQMSATLGGWWPAAPALVSLPLAAFLLVAVAGALLAITTPYRGRSPDVPS